MNLTILYSQYLCLSIKIDIINYIFMEVIIYKARDAQNAEHLSSSCKVLSMKNARNCASMSDFEHFSV